MIGHYICLKLFFMVSKAKNNQSKMKLKHFKFWNPNVNDNGWLSKNQPPICKQDCQKLNHKYDTVKTVNKKNSLFLVKNQSVSDDMWQQNKK
jgi:hypothetical protein